MDVADPVIDSSGSDPWIQDSVEIYVDGGNAKNGTYRADDTQIRIGANGAVSFGTGDEAAQRARVVSAVALSDGGYRVEAAIDLLSYGGLGTFQGLDFQVNDASEGARTSISNWADPTGAGYQSTAHWGVGELVEGKDAGPTPPTPPVDAMTVTLGKTTVTAGGQLTVSVSHATPGASIEVWLHSEPVLLARGTVSSTGTYTPTVTIPASTAAGAHTITVVTAAGEASAPLTVRAAGSGSLAATGSDSGVLALLSLALLLAGAAAVRLRQRAARR
jgi:endo-1,4-beta-xylanase